MSATGNQTFDRIQQEIKENLERENELRKKYTNGTAEIEEEEPPVKISNGLNQTNGHPPTMTNGNSVKKPFSTPAKHVTTPQNNVNGLNRLFAPNASRGMMQKFFKMRGKVNGVAALKSPTPKPMVWSGKDTVEPPKVTLEAGKDIRNGFVSAEEKMRRELLEFQKREADLRKERRQSQPDLMAALEAEMAGESNLKPASALYSSGDLTDDSGAGSMKPARSLSNLLMLDELDSPGTHSLIRQFERLGNKQS